MKSLMIILLFMLLRADYSTAVLRRKAKINVPEIISSQESSTTVDPLAIHIALGQTQQQRTGSHL